MTKVLAGKEVVVRMRDDLLARVSRLAAAGVVPCLSIVRVGENPDDVSYERSAMRLAEGMGVAVCPFVLPASASTDDVLAVVNDINADDSVHGCLLLRPLPPHVDEKAVCDALDASKDVDGVSQQSLSTVFSGLGDGYPPATAQACLETLDHYGIEIAGKRIAVLGRSLVIGKPVAMLMLDRNATVTICHSRTADLPAVCREADIVICATGRARAYGAAHFREGQVILDVGINFDATGQLCGDVDFQAVDGIVDAITPVPGGLGSVTTCVTMAHVVSAAEVAAGAVVEPR